MGYALKVNLTCYNNYVIMEITGNSPCKNQEEAMSKFTKLALAATTLLVSSNLFLKGTLAVLLGSIGVVLAVMTLREAIRMRSRVK